MEFQTQPSNASASFSSSSSPYPYMTPPTSPNEYSTYPYVTPPTSPNEYSRCNSMELYHSAPTSPRRPTATMNVIDDDNDHHRRCDNFEFETSKKWDRCRDPVDSPLPLMAFADELFLNGLVMPLKLPPGLRSDGERSTVTSPRSPRSTTVCRIPTFGRKNSWWNDDFDPFATALQKVREEEKRGRNGHHRRSRSYSPLPFRANENDDQEFCQGRSNSSSLRMEPMQVGALVSPSGPLDFKGSGYARWVRAQMKEGLSPKGSPSWSVFGRRVWPLKIEPGSDKGNKSCVKKEECGDEGSGNKVQKLKGLLLRYASFGGGKQKKTTVSEARKNPSYFRRLSFRFKGNNGQGNGKKKMVADDDGAKMAMVEYKPSIAVCLGYGVGSPNYKVK